MIFLFYCCYSNDKSISLHLKSQLNRLFQTRGGMVFNLPGNGLTDKPEVLFQ